MKYLKTYEELNFNWFKEKPKEMDEEIKKIILDIKEDRDE
jgi:hypothetical protein